MLYGLLLTLFVLLGVFIILFVLIQQSKGSLGIGSMGGETQMLFGGSGGQNFLQKATWIMGALFIILSLALALMKSSIGNTRYLKQTSAKTEIVPSATAPVAAEAAEAQKTSESESQSE